MTVSAGAVKRTVLAVLAVLALWPGAAQAAQVIDGATIEGQATGTSSPAGGVLPATLTVTLTSGSRWYSTRVSSGGFSACVNTANYTSGTRTVSLTVTAPATPGAHDVSFTVYGDESCAGEATQRVLEDALQVTAPYPNPDLPPRCGINVMLVLDESGSIDAAAAEQVRAATREFLQALSGTGSAVSIIEFDSAARRPVPYTVVTPQTIADQFETYLEQGFRPSVNATNWESAFRQVNVANAQGPVADLVVFITDGDPNTYYGATGSPVISSTFGTVSALRPAAAEADHVKRGGAGVAGSHVFAIGVGQALANAASAARLTAVSGPDEFSDDPDGPPFGSADFALVPSFDALGDELSLIVGDLCESSLSITKQVDAGDGQPPQPHPGWHFTAAVDMSEGGFAWVQPPPATPPDARTAVTDDFGVANFQWDPQYASAESTVTLDEAVQPGYELEEVACTVTEPTRRRRVARTVRATRLPLTLTIPAQQFATCTALNRLLPGTITIIKQARPRSDQAFVFSGSLGDFTLVDDGEGEGAAQTFTRSPGTYTVAEAVPDGWNLESITCAGTAATATSGAEVTITLTYETAAICTFRNTQTLPPGPQPEPSPTPGPVPAPTPTPAPPPRTPPPTTTPPVPPPPADALELPATAAAQRPTRLRVVKTARRSARIGDQIRFSITVTNTGSVPATGVELTDTPWAATRVSAGKGARVRRGGVSWRIGTLAPGARRTVRGVVRALDGSPGRKRNIAYATAVNARTAFARADTRLLGPLRAPAVLG